MLGGTRSDRRTPNNPLIVWFGTIAFIVFGLALVTSLVNLWPSIERISSTTGASATHSVSTVRLFFALVTVQATPSTTLLLLVVLAGALGSLIHAATSFADFVGNRRFYSSWAAWYVLRPVVGVALALLVYFAVRGGFLSGASSASDINPYGIAAFAGLAGLFSKQATDKLREVFETLFHVSSKAGDAQRKDDLANAAPSISVIDPGHLSAGATNVKISVHGEHFIENATTGRIDGVARPTDVVSTQLIEMAVPDELTVAPGTLAITVFNGPPGGGESQPLNLPIVP